MIGGLQRVVLDDLQDAVDDLECRVDAVAGIARDRATAGQDGGSQWRIFPGKLIRPGYTSVDDIGIKTIRGVRREIDCRVEGLVIVVLRVVRGRVPVAGRVAGDANADRARWNHEVGRRRSGRTGTIADVGRNDVLQGAATRQRRIDRHANVDRSVLQGGRGRSDAKTVGL